MKVALLSFCTFLPFLLSCPLSAQDSPVAPIAAPPVIAVPSSMPDGEVITDPICFNIINNAPYTVFGTLASNVYTSEDGIKARHRSNFRLEPAYKTQFCTLGPFYEGRKMELILRTLIPVFSCKTAVTGDILIYGKKKPEGGTDTWAECLESPLKEASPQGTVDVRE